MLTTRWNSAIKSTQVKSDFAEFHLNRGDFEALFRSIIGDMKLLKEKKIEAEEERLIISKFVQDRYLYLAKLAERKTHSQ